jgi:hypothetical protein
MSAATSSPVGPRPHGSLSPGAAILGGTLVVGILDLADAIVFFGLRAGIPFRTMTPRVLRSIASGWLGREAFQGGAWIPILGLASHFFIAFGIVTVFYVASRIFGALRARPFLIGPLYGILVYFIMNLVVVPLSAAGGRWPPAMAVLVNGLLIHALGVGLPSALVARAARG